MKMSLNTLIKWLCDYWSATQKNMHERRQIKGEKKRGKSHVLLIEWLLSGSELRHTSTKHLSNGVIHTEHKLLAATVNRYTDINTQDLGQEMGAFVHMNMKPFYACLYCMCLNFPTVEILCMMWLSYRGLATWRKPRSCPRCSQKCMCTSLHPAPARGTNAGCCRCGSQTWKWEKHR